MPPDRIGVHYDFARLIRVISLFDMVQLVDTKAVGKQSPMP